jgi:hypothetical protein
MRLKCLVSEEEEEEGEEEEDEEKKLPAEHISQHDDKCAAQ